MTPSVVLEASGHVERFTDFMVQDALTKDCHRADHLLEDALEMALRDSAKAGLTPERIQVALRCSRPGCSGAKNKLGNIASFMLVLVCWQWHQWHDMLSTGA